MAVTVSERKVVENLLSFKYRRFLVERRLWFCYSAMVFSLYGLFFGFLLAQFEMKQIYRHIIVDAIEIANYTTDDITSQYLQNPSIFEPGRATISISTLLTCFLVVCYHLNEIQIYKFDNSLSPTIKVVSKDLYVFMITETCLTSIHPVWISGSIISFVEYPHLYFIMLLRILFCYRIAIVHSALFFSAKVETVASLNRVSTGKLNYENIRLILRSFMAKHAPRIMFCWVGGTWLMIATCIYLAENQYNIANHVNHGVASFGNALWMVPITFTTIGYGDFAPKSTAGRMFSVWLGLSGAISTAVLIGLMNDKLAMTRRERLLHRVLQDDATAKALRHRAAILLQRLWRSHRKGNLVLQKPVIRQPDTPELEANRRISIGQKGFVAIIHDTEVLRAIISFRSLRVRSMFIEDSMTDLVDIGIMQMDFQKSMMQFDDRMNTMESKLDALISMVGQRGSNHYQSRPPLLSEPITEAADTPPREHRGSSVTDAAHQLEKELTKLRSANVTVDQLANEGSRRPYLRHVMMRENSVASLTGGRRGSIWDQAFAREKSFCQRPGTLPDDGFDFDERFEERERLMSIDDVDSREPSLYEERQKADKPRNHELYISEKSSFDKVASDTRMRHRSAVRKGSNATSRTSASGDHPLLMNHSLFIDSDND